MLRVFDLEGEEITDSVIGLDLNIERCIARVVVKEGGLRFYSGGRSFVYEVRVSRIEGKWQWR